MKKTPTVLQTTGVFVSSYTVLNSTTHKTWIFLSKLQAWYVITR